MCKRIFRWNFALAALLLCAAAADRSHAAGPNILLILADDVGCETLGCYGGSSYETPQIDKLAADGLRFTHCFAMPVCHPTRVTLLSGKYPFRLNNPGWGSYPKDEEQNTIAHAMKEAGYATAVAGKWQLTLLKRDPEHPHRMGFDQYSLFGWHEGARYHDPLIWQNGEIRDDTQGKYGPDLYVDFLIDFIRDNRERPWLALYSMALWHEVTGDLKDELGLRENTVVIFTTDNGTAGRSKLRAIGNKNKFEYEKVVSKRGDELLPGGKGSLTDLGTNVPLIIRWPAQIKRADVTDTLVDMSDFFPTCVELASKTPPAGLDGHGFAPLLTGEAFDEREFAYAQHRGKFWVRNQRFKLYDDGRLFDLVDDPREKKPIPADKQSPAAAAARKALSSAIDGLDVAK